MRDPSTSLREHHRPTLSLPPWHGGSARRPERARETRGCGAIYLGRNSRSAIGHDVGRLADAASTLGPVWCPTQPQVLRCRSGRRWQRTGRAGTTVFPERSAAESKDLWHARPVLTGIASCQRDPSTSLREHDRPILPLLTPSASTCSGRPSAPSPATASPSRSKTSRAAGQGT